MLSMPMAPGTMKAQRRAVQTIDCKVWKLELMAYYCRSNNNTSLHCNVETADIPAEP